MEFRSLDGWWRNGSPGLLVKHNGEMAECCWAVDPLPDWRLFKFKVPEEESGGGVERIRLDSGLRLQRSLPLLLVCWTTDRKSKGCIPWSRPNGLWATEEETAWMLLLLLLLLALLLLLLLVEIDDETGGLCCCGWTAAVGRRGSVDGCWAGRGGGAGGGGSDIMGGKRGR
jgi:hypothetical protein